MKSYQTVERYCRRLAHLGHLQAIAGWDEAVMMPKGGAEMRGAALAELAGLRAEIFRKSEFSEALDQAESESAALNEWQKANLREARMHHRHMMAVDPKLFEEKARLTVICEQAWRELRAANNWKEFQPYLKRLLTLVQEEAKSRASASGLPVYDAMLEMYEPGLTTATVDRVFNQLKQVLPDLIERVIDRQKSRQVTHLGRTVPVDKQKPMMRDFMNWVGFNFDHGRLDESHHPFCGGVPDDVRLTTRYSESDFLSGLMGVLHETGHALYEQNLPKEWREQPIGQARGMAVHESQSLFVEMQIGRSREFWQYAAPILKRSLGESHDPHHFWDPENLFFEASRVEKSYIRVDADEVTYPAHVILRYEIEKALLLGDLAVEDLPVVWDEKMRAYLALSTLGNDANGCMQDVHWPAGLFGYFPSYTLGAIIAAQLFSTVEKDLGRPREMIARGEVAPIMSWLKEKVWSVGSHQTTEGLLKQATGRGLDIEPFLLHLETRYLMG